MTESSPVLVTWVAVNNDPFERERGSSNYREVNGQPVPGPTLTLLFDEESCYAGKIRDVMLLHGPLDGARNQGTRRAIEDTQAEIRARAKNIRVEPVPWTGEDPTDHEAIFEFLRELIPKLRRRFPARELLIHVSPGTPAMHTLWVLMAETGFVQPPYQLIKSYRKEERRGRPAVSPVRIGIETFYKVYMASRPSQVPSVEQSVLWDPAKFRSERMRALFAEARRFAHLDVPIMLLGERGTGKSTLAGWIRMHSPHRRESLDARWPAVACGQYTPETMRDELFGHVKHAFTDAKQERVGLLALADGDTLFLDEIGDIGRELQRLLIKALEEKRFLPLGADEPRKSHFRLLTATNLEPEKLRERLDADFLDRISYLTLQLPALRDIPEELPWLWEDVYTQAARRAGIGGQRMHLADDQHRKIVKALERHPLPGNMRDLLRVAYRVLAARSDPHEPLSSTEAVDYGLEALTQVTARAAREQSQAVARAFAESLPLDAVIGADGRLSTKEVEREFKAYIANELRRISKQRNVPIEDLCDKSGRTLQDWSGESKRKNASTSRKNSSERG